MVTQPRLLTESADEINLPRSRSADKYFRSAVGPEVTNFSVPTILEVNVDGEPEVLLTDVSLAQINLRI